MMQTLLENLLLSASLCDTACDYVCYYVPRLDPREEQLTDLAQTADRVQVSLTKCPHTTENVDNASVRVGNSTSKIAHPRTLNRAPMMYPMMVAHGLMMTFRR